MSSKTTKSNSFEEIIIKKIDEYTDKAFETTEPEVRQKYREVIKILQGLVLLISKLP